MRIIVISSCDILREGIVAIASKYEDISVSFASKTLKEVLFMVKGNMADILLLDIHEGMGEEIDVIDRIMALKSDIKLLVMDLKERREPFLRALRSGAHGYISGKTNTEDLIFALNQIYKGKKYFDPLFVDCFLRDYGDLYN